MIRVMLDTDQLSALDGNCELLATYSDLVPHPGELRAKFPNSHILLIDRGTGDPSGQASIMDVETGAHSVADIPAWLDRKAAQGVKYRTLYVNRSNMAAAQSAAGARVHYLWVATLDGTAFVGRYRALHGPAAIQILPEAKLDAHDDLSLVFEDSWEPTGSRLPANVLRREIHSCISANARLGSELHRVAGQV